MSLWHWAIMGSFTPYPRQTISEEQLTALLAKLRNDTGLLEKLKAARNLDASSALAKEAGFDVSKAD
jgi:predicted ribosomally synthesized peptide with nif11-like leader